MRFDMRAPPGGTPSAELYATALDMCAHVETRGCVGAVVCEHHASPDGYLPAPLILASALAARTTLLPISITLLLLPLYDPVRLAEAMAVLDIISRGRTYFVCGVGYRREEYAMLGVDFARRGAIMNENLAILLRAKSGEPFEHEGRSIHVTPAPFTPGGPRVGLGGKSLAAARRAGQYGLDLIAQTDNPALRNAYLEAAAVAGKEPGRILLPAATAPSQVFVADDVDAAWRELGPYMMQDVIPYAAWNAVRDTNNISSARTWQELREENRSHRVWTVEEARDWISGGRPLPLHPLIGGLPPKVAWHYLQTVLQRVCLPAAPAD